MIQKGLQVLRRTYTVAPHLSRNKILIDSGAFIALGWQGDQHHQAAVELYRKYRKSWQMFTSNHVIAETYTWFRYHATTQNAFVFLDTIERLQSEGRLSIIYAGQEIEEKAKHLLHQHRDLVLSYPDAVTGAIIADLNIFQVFGFDEHLSVFGSTLFPGKT